MEAIQLKENLYWVGVRDKNLKVFDIIMETKYGTTYNSYLIKGDKNILIETAKVSFYDEYISKIKKLIDLNCIDYIIINHTEPDHSGSIKNLLTECPNAQVVCTKPAYMYLKAMVNGDLNCKTVNDGDILNLGGKTFKFILAPFLHWPDTMFTYFVDENVLFTCDAFGCHFCPDDEIILDKDSGDFSDAFEYYYNVIMGPFKEHILKAIDKIHNINADMICTSHGPVLTNNIQEYINKYKAWSIEGIRKSDRKYVLIAYVSAYGFTRTIADKLYETISDCKELDVEIINISDYDLDDIKKKIEFADAVLLGSPTFNQDALKPVWDVISVVCPINVRGKLAAAFGSYGWSGEAVKMLEERLRSLKFKVIESGLRFNFAPSDDDLLATKKFAEDFIKMIK